MTTQIQTPPTTIAPVTEAITIKLTTLATFGSTQGQRPEPCAAYLVIAARPSKWSTDRMPTGHGAPTLQIGEGRGWSWFLSTLIGLKEPECQRRMYLPSNTLSVDFGSGLVCTNAAALVEECLGRLLGSVKP